MALDGSNPRRLTKYPADDFDPSWSPDGRHIAFYSYRDGNWEIYVMGSDGSNPRRLTNHRSRAWPSRAWSPSWSPDGEHIAFVSDHYDNVHKMLYGNEEIYVMEFREAGSDGTPLDHGD